MDSARSDTGGVAVANGTPSWAYENQIQDLKRDIARLESEKAILEYTVDNLRRKLERVSSGSRP